MNIRKCAVIGCGFVGATTAFTLSGSGLFSELVLIDINKKKAEGEAMDINHGLSFRKPMKIYAGDYEDLADCSLIIITAGANQEIGQTRLDLIKKNGHKIIDRIDKYKAEHIERHQNGSALFSFQQIFKIHLFSLSFKKSVFSPDHFVDHAGVALDELHNLGRYILVHIVRHRESVVTLLVHLYCYVYSLKQVMLIDAGEDEASLVEGFWALCGSADADCWE